MQLEKIISISGKPGLFKLVSQLRNGFIVENISTKKKMSIGNSSQVSLLDNVAMFTKNGETALFDVFENVAKNSEYKEAISHKSDDKELKEFMEKSLPGYDDARVYTSDIKKLAQWYNLLHKAGYITPESFVKTAEPAENTQEGTAVKEDNAEKKPVAKKSAPKTEKPAAPKAKASTSAAKSAPKSTHRKQG